MDKVFQINLAGVIFTIEEKAYQQLSNYLAALKSHFANNHEIVVDIEARMSELFSQKIGSNNTIFTNHVDEVIATMGNLNDLTDGEKTHTDQHAETDIPRMKKLRRNPYNESLGGVCSGIGSFFGIDPVIIRILFVVSLVIYGSGILFYLILWVVLPKATGEELDIMLMQKKSNNKKLFRDPDNRVIGGISSGLANYFGLDTVWIRLFFVISLFAFGTGFWLYIIMWVIIPKAVTTSDKLYMRGQNPTISNIHKEFSVNTMNPAKVGSTKNTTVLVKLIKGAAKLFLAFITFIIFLTIVGSSITLITIYFGMGNIAWINHLIAITVDNAAIVWSAKIGVLLTVIIPLITLLFAALKLLFKIKANNKNWLLGLGSLFAIGIGLLLYASISFANLVKYPVTKNKYTKIAATDTLYVNGIKLNEDYESENEELVFYDKGVIFNNNQVFFEIDRFKVVKIASDSAVLKVSFKSNGKDIDDAVFNTKQIIYVPIIKGNNISIPQFLSLNQGAPFRWQEVEVELQVPEGTKLFFSESAKEILDESNIDQADGSYYQMINGELICVDCNNDFTTESTENDAEEVKIKAGPIDIEINDKNGDNNGEVKININNKDKVTTTKKVTIKNGKKTTIEETKVGPLVIKRKVVKEEN